MKNLYGAFILIGLSVMAANADTPSKMTIATEQVHISKENTTINKAALEKLDEMVQTNAVYRQKMGEKYFKALKDGQTPRVTIVSCSDSRVHKSSIDASPENDLFSIRNIGNQISTNEGSVAYGIEHLHTPMLLIVGHSRCGAIKAAMSDYSGENAAIRREVDSLSLSIRRSRNIEHLDNNTSAWIEGVVANVNQQVSYALQTYGDKVSSGDLAIVGAVYDLANDLGKGYGRFEIININGETNIQKLLEDTKAKKSH